MRNMFLKLGFWGRLFVFVTLTVFLMIGAVILGDIIAYFVFGRDAIVHSDVSVVYLLQSFLAVGLFLLPPMLMVKLCCEGSLMTNLMVSKPPKVLQILVSVSIVIVSAPMVSWLEDFNLRMTLPDSMASIENWMREREDAAAQIVSKLVDSPDPMRYVLNIVVLALLPALCEEMYFRVGVQTRLLGDKSRVTGTWAVVLTAVIFSALHLQFYGFLPRMVLGAVLGFMLMISGNVWYSIIAHFVNNIIAVTIPFMTAKGVEMVQVQCLDTWWMALLSAAATALMLVVMSKIEKMEKKF